MKFRVINVEWLIQGNPQGSLSGSSNIGCDSHIAVSVTNKSYLGRVHEWNSPCMNVF